MENSNNFFVSVLKLGSQSHVTPEITKPDLVLDDTCIKEFDFGMSLMRRAKDVYVIPNLPYIISKECFQNVKLSYLGGMWVLFEFDSLTAKEKFLNHSGIDYWFTELIQATNSFENDERIVWISIEGLPIKAWTSNTFRKIASLWGEYVEWEDDDLKSLSCKSISTRKIKNRIHTPWGSVVVTPANASSVLSTPHPAMRNARAILPAIYTQI
ncbi:RNA-directed DNA polymerase, eukaryota, nucleotide-binding alpha-beta plait domain protein [Tanacetum coccineum]